MRHKYKKIAAGLTVMVCGIGLWGSLEIRDNLNGVCHEVGRPLTDDEKKQQCWSSLTIRYVMIT